MVFADLSERCRSSHATVIAVYEKAAAEGLGSVGHKGVMVDAASARLFQNTVDRADFPYRCIYQGKTSGTHVDVAIFLAICESYQYQPKDNPFLMPRRSW